MELSNANCLVIDMPTTCMVIVCVFINVLGKRLYRVLYGVLYNACLPDMAGWY